MDEDDPAVIMNDAMTKTVRIAALQAATSLADKYTTSGSAVETARFFEDYILNG